MSGMTICRYLWVAFFVVWVIWAWRTKPTQVREDVGSRLSYIVFTLAAYVVMFSRDVPIGWLRIAILPNSLWLRVLGIAITAGGLGFAIWARAYLGGNWSSSVTVKVGHELVRTGPYCWVRHPIYTGMISAMLGTAIERRQIRGAIAFSLLYVGFAIKSSIEERAMRNTFGSQYEEYSRSTGRIFPKVTK